jgi:DNA-binding transcriptional MerR regulator
MDVGYRGPAACTAAGITYRQLDYWTTTGLVTPSVRAAEGSGSQRLYAFEDIVLLKVIKRLLDTGVSLQRIRTAIEFVRERGLSLRSPGRFMAAAERLISLYADAPQPHANDRVVDAWIRLTRHSRQGQQASQQGSKQRLTHAYSPS